MNADELRALQAPLKERYRENPETALITFHAVGRLSDGVRCQLNTPHGTVTSGLHPAAGGDGRDLCSGDMLLEALVGCAGVTLRAVATAMGVTLRDATVEGRLTLDEFADRVERAELARTDTELAEIVADLPRPAPPTSRSSTAPGSPASPGPAAGSWPRAPRCCRSPAAARSAPATSSSPTPARSATRRACGSSPRAWAGRCG